MMPNRRVTVKRGYLLMAACAIAGVAILVGALITRANFSDSNTGNICSVIRTQIARASKALRTPGSPGYSYYLVHPDERRTVEKSNRALLAELGTVPDCPILKETHRE